MVWLIGLILLSLPAAAFAQDELCAVEGAHVDLDEVLVPLPGEPPLSLTVTDSSVSAQPHAGAHRVSVRAGLAFSGESSSPVFSLSRAVDASSGMVRMSTGARLSRVRPSGRNVSVTAELGYLVRVVGVVAPCDALTLDAPPNAGPGPTQDPGDGSSWAPRSRSVTFRLRPGAGPRLRARAEVRELFRLSRHARRGDHFLVSWAGPDGSGIRGWVDRSALLPLREIHGFGTTGGVGRLGCLPGRRGGTSLYAGPATVRPGADVHSSPSGARWATFAQSEPASVYHVLGEEWVQVAQARGVTDRERCELSSAWVRLADVALPADAHAHVQE